MQTLPIHEFYALVWDESLEHSFEVSHFYEGIYSVTLNQFVTIMFVPKVNRDKQCWPPNVPDCIDYPVSQNEAYLWTIGLSDYVVTPNPDLVDQEEVIDIPSFLGENHKANKSHRKGVIFYTSSEQFKIFSEELCDINTEIHSVHDKVILSEKSKFSFVDFIIHKVIPSPRFSKKDLESLRKYNGTK